MLVPRIKAEQFILQNIDKFLFENDLLKEFAKSIYQKYNYPEGDILDYLYHRKEISEATEIVLFYIIEQLDKDSIAAFFTDSEIERYSKYKYKRKLKDISLLKIDCIEVNPDQWIGCIDTDFLMNLRENQLINYNTNIQRPLELVVKSTIEYYRIKLNKKAVNKIVTLLLNKTYIPTTLTFNIPIDSDCEFNYDAEKKQLVIRNLDKFDVTDGYHRYLAYCRACDTDDNFEYKTELRITNFPELKAQQFIYQEDQKTKIEKASSESMNSNNKANIIVERMNHDVLFNLVGKIGRNGEQVSFQYLAMAVKYYYMSEIKNPSNKQIMEIQREIIEKFNLLTYYSDEYLNMRYGFNEIAIIFYAFKNFGNDKDLAEKIEKALQKKEMYINDIRFKRKKIGKTLEKSIKQLFG